MSDIEPSTQGGAGAGATKPAGKLQTIPLKEIPISILESLLKVQIERHFGKLTESELMSLPMPEISETKKRTIADVNSSIDWNEESRLRESYINDEIVKYKTKNITTNNNSIVNTSTEQPILDILKISTLETMKAGIRYNHNNTDSLVILDETVCEMSKWAGQYLSLLAQRLKRLTEMQRRKIPNRDDVRILAREGLFNNIDIHDMYDLTNNYTKVAENREKIKLITQKSNAAITAFTGNDNGAFNEINDFMQDPQIQIQTQTQSDPWIDKIVPKKKRKPYVYEWMPPFPPDYTYKATPKYNSRVTNPVILRERLAKEARLGEKALDHIIIRKDDSLLAQFSDDSVSSSDVDGEEEQEQKEKEEKDGVSKLQNGTVADSELELKPSDAEPVKSPDPDDERGDLEKKVDLVALANERMKILNERRKQEEERINKRLNSDESKFGRIFGSYTNLKKLPSGINEELVEYRKNNFHSLIKNLRKQEKWTVQWQAEQEELRKKISEENKKYTQENEIQIGMGGTLLPEGDIMMDEEVDFEMEFSDMEDFDDVPATGNDIVKDKPSGEGKNLTVRFDDEVKDYDGDNDAGAKSTESSITDEKGLGEVVNTITEEVSIDDFDAADFAEEDLGGKDSFVEATSIESSKSLAKKSIPSSDLPPSLNVDTSSAPTPTPSLKESPQSDLEEEEEIDMDLFEE